MESSSQDGQKINLAKVIPWRDKVKGPSLKLSLVKMVVVKGVDLKKGANGVNAQQRNMLGNSQ